MNREQSHPPRIALWILRRLYPTRNNEAVTGDLIERFRQGQSVGWFWYQTLAAILVEASRTLRSRRIDISLFAAAGTAVIWCVPWAQIFPLQAMTGSMNWDARLEWMIAIEIATVLIVLPVYALRLLIAGALRWSSFPEFLITSFVLFTVGDAALLGWDLGRPHVPVIPSTWLVAMQLMWIFAALLVSGRIASKAGNEGTLP